MKNFFIVVCVIVVVCLLGYAGKYVNEDSVIPTNNVQTEQKQNISSTNKNNNSVKEDKTEEKNEEKKEEIKVEDENKENEQEQEKEVNKEEIEESKDNEPVVEENSISSEEKAISLAKKEYGSSNGVYFRIEQIQSNGVYIVSVRDTETTKDLAWYTVDVNSGIVK